MGDKQVSCIFLLISSVIFGCTLIAASIFSLVVFNRGEWFTEKGIFGTALMEIGKYPLIIALLTVIIGIIFLIRALTIKKTSNK